MKKIMIAAAMVCAAAISHAGTFTWGTSNTTYMPWAITSLQEGTFAAATSGSSSRKIDGTGWKDCNFKAIIALTVDGETVKTEEFAVKTSSGSILTPNISNSLFEIPGKDQTKDVFYSIVITGEYTDTNKDKWTITSSTIANDTAHPFVLTDQSMEKLTTASPTKWTFEKASAVPEPTSGLLLLLGVAGMALRRRRA